MNTNNASAQVTVYSKPACMQCTMTKKALEKRGIAYAEVDITENAAALAHVRRLGYSQAPVIQIDEGRHFSGFRPDLVEELAAALGRTA